ncbi:hypothetical protein LCGC14_0648180 [marine sediment metagenome]|uniref:Uncharacterized protein n=1 Tax=marine sediment metagenome TaxID=412755 RepID=A0A0F9QX72_9ZZZZ
MPNIHELSSHVAIDQVIDPISVSSAGTANGDSLDMQEYDGCLFLLSVGAIAPTGTIDAKITSDALTAFGSPTDVPGAALTQIDDIGDDKVYAIDVHGKMPEQFIRIEVTDAVAVARVRGVLAIRYRGRRAPVVQSADVAELVSVALT